MRRDRLKILWNGRRAVHKCVEGRGRGRGDGEGGSGEKGLVVCRGLTIPLRRPSLGWMGVGRGGGRRNYAKNVQLVNRARGGGARVLGGGDGVPERELARGFWYGVP